MCNSVDSLFFLFVSFTYFFLFFFLNLISLSIYFLLLRLYNTYIYTAKNTQKKKKTHRRGHFMLEVESGRTLQGGQFVCFHVGKYVLVTRDSEKWVMG